MYGYSSMIFFLCSLELFSVEKGKMIWFWFEIDHRLTIWHYCLTKQAGPSASNNPPLVSEKARLHCNGWNGITDLRPFFTGYWVPRRLGRRKKVGAKDKAARAGGWQKTSGDLSHSRGENRCQNTGGLTWEFNNPFPLHRASSYSTRFD